MGRGYLHAGTVLEDFILVAGDFVALFAYGLLVIGRNR